jgi:hypothetical protein
MIHHQSGVFIHRDAETPLFDLREATAELAQAVAKATGKNPMEVLFDSPTILINAEEIKEEK